MRLGKGTTTATRSTLTMAAHHWATQPTSASQITRRYRRHLETAPSGDDESTTIPYTTVREEQPQGSEQGGATRVKAQAYAAVEPVSREGLSAHQHREPHNLGLLANPAAFDVGAEHKIGIILDAHWPLVAPFPSTVQVGM